MIASSSSVWDRFCAWISPERGGTVGLFAGGEVESEDSRTQQCRRRTLTMVHPRVYQESWKGNITPFVPAFLQISMRPMLEVFAHTDSTETHLDVSSSQMTDEQLIELVSANPGLISLNISGCPITDAGFKEISKLERLETLIAQHLPQISPEALITIPTARLTFLQLGNLRGSSAAMDVNDEVCRHLSQAKLLVHLDLSGTPKAEGVTDRGVLWIVEALRELRFLSLSNRFQGTSAGLLKLNRLKKLQSLDLSSDAQRRYVNREVLALLGAMPCLTTLKLTGCINGGESDFSKLFFGSRLTALWIDWNDPRLYQGIQYLPKGLLELKISAPEEGTILDEALCKQISRLSSLRELSLMSYFLEGKRLHSWRSCLANLEKIEFQWADALALSLICQEAPRLRSFETDPREVQMEDEDLEPILSLTRLKSLSGIEMSAAFAVKLSQAGIRLEALKIGVSEPETLEQLKTYASNLRSLTIVYHAQGDSGAGFLAAFTQLETLVLFTNFSLEDYRRFLPRLLNLKVLVVSDQRGGSADAGFREAIHEITAGLSMLETVWVM